MGETTSHKVSLGRTFIEVMVDGSGIIVDVTGDPRGKHYVGQKYSEFQDRRRRKQIRYGTRYEEKDDE